MGVGVACTPVRMYKSQHTCRRGQVSGIGFLFLSCRFLGLELRLSHLVVCPFTTKPSPQAYPLPLCYRHIQHLHYSCSLGFLLVFQHKSYTVGYTVTPLWRTLVRFWLGTVETGILVLSYWHLLPDYQQESMQELTVLQNHLCLSALLLKTYKDLNKLQVNTCRLHGTTHSHPALLLRA